MSESFVWATDVLSSSVWSCYSDSTKLRHKTTFLCTVLLCYLAEPSWSLLQYLTVYLYKVSCCECVQIFWYLSQVLWRLRYFTWGLWREPNVVWCGPNVIFLSLSHPITCPSSSCYDKKEMRGVFNTMSGIRGIRAILEEQQKKKGDYPYHIKKSIFCGTKLKTCTFFDVACLTYLLKGKYTTRWIVAYRPCR